MDKSPTPGSGAWSGRFRMPMDRRLFAFNASFPFDRRLAAWDLAASRAHAAMLGAQGIVSPSDARALDTALAQLQQRVADGDVEWDERAEDVHTFIERQLVTAIGESGKRLHTARSRNDQVATAMRMYVRDAAGETSAAVRTLQGSLLVLAERHAADLMPGYTHLQTAQPVTLGHHLMAYHEMLARDRDRLADCARRANQLPLGSAALAGTTFPVDRERVAAELGFAGVCRNSMDAVSDRDFVLDYQYAASVLMVHLSRLCEELILWSGSEFGFIELPDAFCTGSSIMPQKKNPDVPELVRGKSGRVCGHLLAALMVMKAQPLSYNKDNQECQQALFDSHDTLLQVLGVLPPMLDAMTVRTDRMRAAAGRGYSTATDLADALVRAGLAFRDSHEVVARAVQLCAASGRSLEELPFEELVDVMETVTGRGKELALQLPRDLGSVLSLDACVAARDHVGGTAPARVRAEVARARGAAPQGQHPHG